jgi:hypothetical protein
MVGSRSNQRNKEYLKEFMSFIMISSFGGCRKLEFYDLGNPVINFYSPTSLK